MLNLPGTNQAAGEAPRPFTVEDFGGVDTKAKRPAIGPKDFFWLENFLPIGPGNMRTLYAEETTPIYSAPVGDEVQVYHLRVGTIRQRRELFT